jgi:hypothetical protein
LSADAALIDYCAGLAAIEFCEAHIHKPGFGFNQFRQVI